MAKFRYYNLNPNGEKVSDCVTRAISLASNISYSTIRSKLRSTARLLDCPKLCPTCYGFLIQQVLGGIPKNCMGMSVGEFADLHPNGTYLIRIQGHLTCVKEPSTVWDIWDCRAKMCDLAWEIR
jgi:hypothetical protein